MLLFLCLEFQYAWDEPSVIHLNVSLGHLGQNKARLVLENGALEGFQDLCHAIMLFAEVRLVTTYESACLAPCALLWCLTASSV